MEVAAAAAAAALEVAAAAAAALEVAAAVAMEIVMLSAACHLRLCQPGALQLLRLVQVATVEQALYH